LKIESDRNRDALLIGPEDFALGVIFDDHFTSYWFCRSN